MADVTFADIDEFCQAGYREGLQLDYKQDFPTDLAKTAAAFANTKGGLLLLGVPASTTTNQPLWPSPGMPTAAGLSERVVQTCRDGIYPSVLPEVSPVIEDPNNAGRVFLVVRVPESVSAPHSITNGTKVYVRTNDVNHPIDLAHIDRIALLLERRRGVDAAREGIIAKHVERLEGVAVPNDPMCWWVCLPEFPHDEICTLPQCQLGVEIGDARRAPEGCLSVPNDAGGAGKRMSFAGKRGDLFYAKSYRSMHLVNLPGDWMARRTWSFLTHAQAFYQRQASSHPGLLRLAFQVANVRSRRMQSFGNQAAVVGSEFPDRVMRIDRTVALEDLVDEQKRREISVDFVTELFHAFDLAPPPPANHWTVGDLMPG